MRVAIVLRKVDRELVKVYHASRSPCPIGRAANILGDRWILLILREAYLGADRFEIFMDRLSISRAALSSRLVMLVDAGLMDRDPPDAKRASYVLTQAGRDLKPGFLAIAQWSTDYLFEGDERPRDWLTGGPAD